MLITKVPPHIFLCVLEVSWAILTFGASGVTKAGHLYLIRFLVGLLEVGHLSEDYPVADTQGRLLSLCHVDLRKLV